MPLSDHVQLNITKNTVGIARAGYGVPLILSANASWTERVRTYTGIAGVGSDFAVDSPEYLAAKTVFSQSPSPQKICIGRSTKPTQAYALAVSAVGGLNHYLLNVSGQGVTPTAIDVFTPAADIVGTLLPRVANVLTSTAHGMSTGDLIRVSNSGGALPTGLVIDTNYWVIAIDANTFSLASTLANAIALTAIALTTDGTGTQTIRRVQNDVICARLIEKLNAVVGKNYTAVQTGSPGAYVITITANAAGSWFSVGLVRPQDLFIAQTHVDPGITTDLALNLQENGSWYALITLYNSKAYMVAAAAWVEANTRVYIADTNETSTITIPIGSATDTATTLRASSYSRTMVAYHPTPSAFMAAAWFGRCLPLTPGSETWNDKTLATVPVVNLTSTHRANLIAKNANSYQEVVSGIFKTFQGMCTDLEWFDTIRGLDYFVDNCSKQIYSVMADASKVPFEDSGIARIEGALRLALKDAVQKTIFAEGSIDVIVPKASDVPSADRANRVLSGVSFTARLSGAIQDVLVSGTVTA